MIVLQKLED